MSDDDKDSITLQDSLETRNHTEVMELMVRWHENRDVNSKNPTPEFTFALKPKGGGMQYTWYYQKIGEVEVSITLPIHVNRDFIASKLVEHAESIAQYRTEEAVRSKARVKEVKNKLLALPSAFISADDNVADGDFDDITL